MFHDHGTGAAQLTGHGETLDEAEGHQQGGCEEADLPVGGEESNSERREAHEQHREDEHLLAAVPVAVRSEHHGTDGPGDIADGVGGQGGDDGYRRVPGREEDGGEDQGCRQ